MFVLGLFIVKGKYKWWLLFGFVLSLVLSWGRYFPALTKFMIDYFPLYNKFRAVSSIQVVLELCAPTLGILALKEVFSGQVKKKVLLERLKWSFFVILGIVGLAFIAMNFFDFEGLRDERYRQNFGDTFMSVLLSERKSVYIEDTLRSLIYIVHAASVLWLFIKKKINKNIATIALGILILFDLVGVALRYVNEDDFVRQRQINTPFQASQIDNAIQQDKAIYRVFDPQEELNGARTSFFHKSIGGYHAAKPKRLQDLFEYHLYQNNTEVMDMLNVKYVIQQDEEGNSVPAINDNRNGNAWFVERIIPVNSPNEEIQGLRSFNSKTEAVVNTNIYPTLTKHNYTVDSLSTIELTEYRPNLVKYRSNNNNEGFAVFSEMYYPNGWKVTIDGKAEEQFRVNYALRGLLIPPGQHDIVFEFEPEVVQLGSQISLASCIVLAIIILGGFGFTLFSGDKKKKDKA
ncbi:MAG: YfhO family protein [Bacteroidota bacterium]